MRSRIWGIRESLGLELTQVTTAELGSRYRVPDRVPAEALPLANQTPAVAKQAAAVAAMAIDRLRRRDRRGDMRVLSKAEVGPRSGRERWCTLCDRFHIRQC